MVDSEVDPPAPQLREEKSTFAQVEGEEKNDERDVDENRTKLLHLLDAVVEVDPSIGRLGPVK